MYEKGLRTKQRLTELVAATVTALREADLTSEIELLESHVFSRDSRSLFDLDRIQASGQTANWQFNPMLELLLLHIRDVASDEKRPALARSREIRWALESAGF